MPENLQGRAQRYRDRAREIRELASSVTTPGAKESLLETASDLERQAEQIERDAVSTTDEST